MKLLLATIVFLFSQPLRRLPLAVTVALCLGSLKLSRRSLRLCLQSQKNRPPWLAFAALGSAALASPLLFLLAHSAAPEPLPAVDYANSK